MAYRVEELAASGGVSVDTIRYYQGLGLLPPPRRQGRVAVYEDSHVDRLGRIRQLAGSGFTLRQIGELVDRGDAHTDPLLEALTAQAPSRPTMSLDDLSRRTGVSPARLRVGIDAGLLHAAIEEGEERFDEEQAEMVATVGRLLDSGVDLDPLVEVATKHATNIEAIVKEAVALYRAAVASQPDRDRGQVAREIQSLVPAVTSLVADHFSRTLIEHAAELVEDDAHSGGSS
jgi:DNA-binding transcriptional MerR regulator